MDEKSEWRWKMFFYPHLLLEAIVDISICYFFIYWFMEEGVKSPTCADYWGWFIPTIGSRGVGWEMVASKLGWIRFKVTWKSPAKNLMKDIWLIMIHESQRQFHHPASALFLTWIIKSSQPRFHHPRVNTEIHLSLSALGFGPREWKRCRKSWLMRHFIVLKT
jgi:hypothetical protein